MKLSLYDCELMQCIFCIYCSVCKQMSLRAKVKNPFLAIWPIGRRWSFILWPVARHQLKMQDHGQVSATCGVPVYFHPAYARWYEIILVGDRGKNVCEQLGTAGGNWIRDLTIINPISVKLRVTDKQTRKFLRLSCGGEGDAARCFIEIWGQKSGIMIPDFSRRNCGQYVEQIHIYRSKFSAKITCEKIHEIWSVGYQ